MPILILPRTYIEEWKIKETHRAMLHTKDYGLPIRAVLILPNIFFFRFGKFDEEVERQFRVFLVVLSVHVLSLCMYPQFVILQILSIFFLQKVKIFLHFTGFSIQNLDMVLSCREFGNQVSYVRSPFCIGQDILLFLTACFYLFYHRNRHRIGIFTRFLSQVF